MRRKIPAYLGECRALFAIAGPMLIAQLAQAGTGVVDTVMAGHYSATDLAAIAIGYNIWLPLYLVFIGVMLGATTIIAQDFGAGRVQAIRDSLPQALWLALGVGLVAAPLCFFSAPLLGLLQLAPDTEQRSLGYLQAVAFGLPAAAIFQALRCHTQGIGEMRPFAIASVIGFLANIPLNYALIYGAWGAPELGAAGCGWATAISMWLSPALIGLHMLRNPRIGNYLPRRLFALPDRRILVPILRLGTPMGLSFFLEVAVFSVIGLLIATWGDTAMAAHQIAYNVWDVAYIFLISCGSALATRVGHAIGAADRDGVGLAIGCGASVTIMVGAACSVVLLATPTLVISAYTDDPGIHSTAAALVGLAALFIVIDATQVTVTFCLRAFKDTSFPFYVLCGIYWFMTLPLGYYLGKVLADNAQDGAMGFWKSMIAGIALSTGILLLRLRRTLARPLPAVVTA
jgi:MATE family multidrug resistance protein